MPKHDADVTIGGRHLLRKYNELKARGYTTVWVGEGFICLRPPAPDCLPTVTPVDPLTGKPLDVINAQA